MLETVAVYRPGRSRYSTRPMEIEISDPRLTDELRAYLQRNGCPSERRTEDRFEVRVLWSPDAPLTEAQIRAKVFGHLRDWCLNHPGVKANLLS
ncbi:MAG: hypothetical protein ACRDQ2_06725 [Gaiellales bacterium]